MIIFEDLTGEPFVSTDGSITLNEADMKEYAEKILLKVSELHGLGDDLEVNLYLTDEENIQELNRENRGVDQVTDVLSFPGLPFDTDHIANMDMLSSIPKYQYTDPEAGLTVLGEIVVCAGRAAKQAEEYGHSLRREFAFLVCHSMLHLFGYDHINDDDRLKMEDMQKKVLDDLGYTRDM